MASRRNRRPRVCVCPTCDDCFNFMSSAALTGLQQATVEFHSAVDVSAFAQGAFVSNISGFVSASLFAISATTVQVDFDELLFGDESITLGVPPAGYVAGQTLPY